MSGAPRAIVVMGVSASGKTSLGRTLADALGCGFVEGDDLHPPVNVAKMKAGVALDDADRVPWLDAVARALGAAEGWTVASCSALKRAYRERLLAAAPRAAFLLIDAPEAVLRHRIAERRGHFMPPSLLASQLTTLEKPRAPERALILDATRPMETNVDEALAWLRSLPG
ncbi:gluconokinase [Sphingomonas sp.]|uniref:gluconokinase n=1 Tax=Sphingomonas sp. TaxID=28214 RepID=UPI003B0064D0